MMAAHGNDCLENLLFMDATKNGAWAPGGTVNAFGLD
jgi:hypothetical protein